MGLYHLSNDDLIDIAHAAHLRTLTSDEFDQLRLTADQKFRDDCLSDARDKGFETAMKEALVATINCGCDPEEHHLCEWHQAVYHVNTPSDVHPPQIRDDGTQWSPLTQAAEKVREYHRFEELRKRMSPEAQAASRVQADRMSSETRITDPTTGGQKGQKLQRFSLIPAEFLWALAEHYGKGAEKYEDRNWERGYHWSLTVDALERHYTQWKQGESRDPETGSSHLIAMAWHVVALFIFERRGLGTDDVRRKA